MLGYRKLKKYLRIILTIMTLLSYFGIEKLFAEGDQVSLVLHSSDGGRCSGSGNYNINDNVNIKAIPDDNYYFDGFYLDDEYTNLYTHSNDYSFEIEETTILYAKFKPVFVIQETTINNNTNDILSAILIINCMLFFSLVIKEYF